MSGAARSDCVTVKLAAVVVSLPGAMAARVNNAPRRAGRPAGNVAVITPRRRERFQRVKAARDDLDDLAPRASQLQGAVRVADQQIEAYLAAIQGCTFALGCIGPSTGSHAQAAREVLGQQLRQTHISIEAMEAVRQKLLADLAGLERLQAEHVATIVCGGAA